MRADAHTGKHLSDEESRSSLPGPHCGGTLSRHLPVSLRLRRGPSSRYGLR